MHKVIYSMGVSLDGYIYDADGDFNWSDPDPEVFQGFLDELGHIDAHLLGRRLYETMLFWETREEDPALSEAEREWARTWNLLPKIVFSRSLTELEGSYRLASGGLAEEIERLKAEPGDGDIAIGGADLATQIADLGLIDEYLVRVHPVLVGGGARYFPHHGGHDRLELVDSRVHESGVVYLRYRVLR